jgi:hypothetical protein
MKAATTDLLRPGRREVLREPESEYNSSEGKSVYTGTRKIHSYDASDGSEDLDEAGPSEEVLGIEEEEDEVSDPDGARVAQWVDEEELVPPEGDDESEVDFLKGPSTLEGSDLQLVCLSP